MKFTTRLLALGLTVSTAYGMERGYNNSPRIPTAMEIMENEETNRAKTQKLLQEGDKVLDILKKTEEFFASLKTRTAEQDQFEPEYLQLKDQLDKIKDQLAKNVKTVVWGGIKLLSGGIGTVTAQANGTAGVTGNGAPVAYNTINNGAATGLTGFVSGTVTDAFARQTGPNQYELTVKVDKQHFQAFTRVPSLSATEPIVFNGVSDVYNSFTLAFVGNGAGITNETVL